MEEKIEIASGPIPGEPTPTALVEQKVGTAGVAENSVAEEKISIEYFSKVKFRVARIISAEPVPKSKKLLRLEIDLGPFGKRQILSGISQFYSPESLVGKKIVVVANLEPAKLMGIESQGMLLAASTEDVSVLSILMPDKDMPEGSIVR